jgi:hypothetical protein
MKDVLGEKFRWGTLEGEILEISRQRARFLMKLRGFTHQRGITEKIL